MLEHKEHQLELLIIRHSRPGFPFNFEAEYQAGTALQNNQKDDGNPKLPVHCTTLLFSELDAAPDPNHYDGVLVFGGAMFVHETHKYPWLLDEMKFIEAVLKAEVPLMGICLGGQLLAHVLGAKVYRLERPEFGYHTITLTKEGLASPVFKGFPESFTAFEWHYEGFDIPHGAEQLAESRYWPHQAFSWGERAFGFQLHLEFSYEHLLYMFEKDRGSIPQGHASTQPIEVTARSKNDAEAIRTSMKQLLENFAELAININKQ